MSENGLKLILASASPRRVQLLRELGVTFAVRVAEVVEWEAADACPSELVRHNARLKAEWVAGQAPGVRVLGADTTVALDGRVFHKPADLDEARWMLRQLSGRTHHVFTGVALISRSEGVEDVAEVVSEVTFRELETRTIEDYLALVNPLDKAGGYGIQEGRELILAKLAGSLSNVMGLPTEYLAERLQALGWWKPLTP